MGQTNRQVIKAVCYVVLHIKCLNFHANGTVDKMIRDLIHIFPEV